MRSGVELRGLVVLVSGPPGSGRTTPEEALWREMREGLGLDVYVGDLINSLVYDIAMMSLADFTSESIPHGYLASVRKALDA